MKVTVLGSGAWEGIPGPYSHNDVAQKAIQDMHSKNFRTRQYPMME